MKIEAMKKIEPQNIRDHLRTVSRHRRLVRKHCFKAGLYWQGLTHDLSKYSPEEFIISCKMYQGTRSPNEAERELRGYSTAWMHHKGRNKHHFEYWNDYDPKTRKNEAVKMPLIYVCEMFCDRVAASKVYMGESYTDSSPLEYFNRGSAAVRLIHPDTAKLLKMLLEMLAEKGEEYTFSYIRRILKKN
ncbi:MAG: DUF5662 family protein [Ruminococcus sp.]|nr:DUF5662 family protein [Ruminococcus sp.]